MPESESSFAFLYLHTALGHGGPGDADDFAVSAAELGYSALACGDYGSVAAWPRFEAAAQARDLAPVFGLSLDARLGEDFAQQGEQSAFQPVLLLAATEQGLKNIVTLHNRLVREQDGRCWCSLDDLRELTPGAWLVLLGVGEFGPSLLAALPRKKAVALAQHIVGALGSPDIALVGLPNGPEQDVFAAIADEAGLATVALPVVRYPTPEAQAAHNALHRAGGWDKDGAQSLVSLEALETQYAAHPDALQQAGLVADACVASLESLRAAGADQQADKLREVVVEALNASGRELTHEIEIELAALSGLRLEQSLLAAREIAATARAQGFYLGSASGAVGSGLVAALLGLCPSNPFGTPPVWLDNPRREALLPGISVAALARPALLRRIDSAQLAPPSGARLATFETGLRLAGEELGIDPGIVADLVRMSAGSQDGAQTLRAALAEGKFSSDQFDLPGLLDITSQLVGSPIGLAPDAELLVALTADAVLPILPLGGVVAVCAWDAATLDRLGFALVSLSGDPAIDSVQRALELAGEDLQEDDADAMRLLITSGDYAGLPLPLPIGAATATNQQPGVLAADIAALLPDDPDDEFGWAVLGALLCGPRGAHPWLSTYVRRRVGHAPYPPLHPAMRDLLEQTNGLPLFSEQVTAIDLRLGHPEVVSPAESLKLRSWLSQSESYTTPYNEALAAGRLVGAALRLKAGRPAAFLAGALQHSLAAGDDNELQSLALEAQRRDIAMLPPDARVSEPGFTVAMVVPPTPILQPGQPVRHNTEPPKWNIRWGLALSPRLQPAARAISIAYAHQSFNSLAELCAELDLSVVTSDMLAELIRAGAFDYLGSRHKLLAALPAALRDAQRTQQQRAASAAQEPSQPDLFAPEAPETEETPTSDEPTAHDDHGHDDHEHAPMEKEAPVAPEVVSGEPRVWEETLLGRVFALHPIVAERLPSANGHTGIAHRSLANLGESDASNSVSLPVVLTSIELISAGPDAQSKGERIAIAWLEDSSGRLPALLFPPIYTRFKALCEPGTAVILTARVRLTELWEGAGAQVVLVCEALALYRAERAEQKLDVTPIKGRRSGAAAIKTEPKKEAPAPKPAPAPAQPREYRPAPVAAPATQPAASAVTAATLPPGLRINGPSVILTLPTTDNELDDESRMRRLKALLARYPGDTAVVLFFPDDPTVGMPTTMPLRSIKVNANDAFCAEVGEMLGAACVQVVGNE